MPLRQLSEGKVSSSSQASAALQTLDRLRVLVAIASFGEKNLEFLRKIIRDYRSMNMDVQLVVNSDAPKQLEAGVKVIVGFPGRNPHSLPFAHKRIFAENIDRYDLFVYSEDDIGISERNIHEFLRATADLQQDEIAGYLRYEIGKDGTVSLPDVHGPFHWKPESVRRRGSYTVAEFTNEHAGFYILTQAQLRRAIASGEYVRVAYEGRYGMLETAATDPYTRCGFRKVICISALDKFLIHHMPNRYAGVLGIPLIAFNDQIQTLNDIHNGLHPATRLCDVEPKILQDNWSKSYYENPEEEVLNVVPRDATDILSVGCGWGALEITLQRRGHKVTVLPLDSIIGAAVSSHGMEVVNGTLAECSTLLQGKKFDCVLVSNILHLLRDPWAMLQEYGSLVSKGGHVVIVGYNFNFLPHLLKRRFGIGEYRKLCDFSQSGVHPAGITTINQELLSAGFQVEEIRWFGPYSLEHLSRLSRGLYQLLKRNWVVRARRVD